MNTAPEPPSEAGSDPAPSPGGAKLLFATVYPLLVGTVLWVLGFFALLGLLYYEQDYAILFVFAAVVLIGGAHFWLQWLLEGRDEPRPWQYPVVLTTAMVAAVVVGVLPVFMGVEPIPPMPLLCLGLCLLGACVFAVAERSYRFVGALAAVLVAALVLAGMTWRSAAQDHAQKREELLRDVSDFPHPIAVLDSPEWEPVSMWADRGLDSAVITYEPVDPSPGFDGFGLILETEPMEPAGEAERSPLHRLCGSEAGGYECEEHEDGKVVVADLSTASAPALEARTEFTDGTAAYLVTKLPTGKDDLPSIEFPDIDGTDMADLAGHVRPAEAGEAEEVVSAVMD